MIRKRKSNFRLKKPRTSGDSPVGKSCRSTKISRSPRSTFLLISHFCWIKMPTVSKESRHTHTLKNIYRKHRVVVLWTQGAPPACVHNRPTRHHPVHDVQPWSGPERFRCAGRAGGRSEPRRVQLVSGERKKFRCMCGDAFTLWRGQREQRGLCDAFVCVCISACGTS